MKIRMLGIDHTLAPLDIRSIFAFTKKAAVSAMEQIKKEKGIEGCVLLSTCNRTELWVSAKEDWNGSLFALLCQIKGVSQERFCDYFTEREGESAIRHLFYLSCGLCSMIMAEDQIITQVKDAHAFAREHYMTDGTLEVLFRKAVTAAKRVKTEVVFSGSGSSSVKRALSTLEERGYDFRNKRCMVIGNGEMGRLAALTLAEKGADVTVTVRQYRSGVVKIPEGCKRIDYGKRMELFPFCDLVLSATKSPNYTIRRTLVEESPPKQPVILIDLAVPRDIEPEILEFPLVTMYDIDDFRLSRDGENEAPYRQAEAILEEEIQGFLQWRSGRELIPRIQSIRQEAAGDLALRLRKVIQRLSISEEEKLLLSRSIDEAAEKTVGKLMFGMRELLEEESFLACVDAMEKVYSEKNTEEQRPDLD